ncbi:hypothetical protein PSACC_00313 [Paramicrosporidium saccamoebae]|uniref:Zinc-binding domain-containing protein n=1 Tax=Paramicrosporidium saccamoebae TaxID=1246581 RepID=A0A2H9TQ69_9FUNG|nr:hypothetical protein PSACC_00313 [Paramicrosporidium saccamoebae]
MRMLCPALKHEMTLNALHRLSTDRAKFLRYFLVQEHARDVWVQTHLATSGDAQAPPSNRFKCARDLTLKHWYSAGHLEECWFCGYRPPKRWVVSEVPYRGLRYVFRCARRCKTCGHRTLGRGLRMRPASEKPWDWWTWDVAAATSSEEIGLGRLFE